jgi:membrane protein required for colicin V production
MTGLDWVFIAVLGVSLLLGVWRGLVREVLSLVNWVLAFYLAQWFAQDAAKYLPMSGVSDVLRYAIGFALVFVVSAFAGGLVVWGLSKLVSSAGLGLVDRSLGAVFGLLRGMIFLLALAVVVAMTPAKSEIWWTQSVMATATLHTLKVIKPVLPEKFAKYLP